MPPIWICLIGFATLALFAFGGHVAGGGDRRHVASAARAFVLPWVLIAIANVWVRWWSQEPILRELLWLIPVILLPLSAAFALWRHYRA